MAKHNPDSDFIRLFDTGPRKRFVKSVDRAVKTTLARKTFDKVTLKRDKVKDVADRTRVEKAIREMRVAGKVDNVSLGVRVRAIVRKAAALKKRRSR